MRQVYSPANSIEAHMLVHMLDQAGIKAHIHGEALQGAVGDLPVSDFIRLLVADEDYEHARAILTNWEKQDAGGAEETGASKSYPVIAALGFAVLGALSGLAGKTLWDNGQTPIDSAMQGLDQNGDGAEDYTYFFRGVGRPAYKTEADFNFDGRTDFIAHYDATGVPERDQRDNDFNGVFETNTTYRDGNALRSDVDTNRDGAADLRVYYRYGVLDREEISDLETGRVVRVNYYRNSLLHRAETDLDRDGSLETVTLFDRYGQAMPGE